MLKALAAIVHQGEKADQAYAMFRDLEQAEAA